MQCRWTRAESRLLRAASRPVCQAREGSNACLDVPSGWSEAARTEMQVVWVSLGAPGGRLHSPPGAVRCSGAVNAHAGDLP